MRIDLFEELAPVCPRCLHGGAVESPLVLAEVAERRSGMVWHGVLHCSNRDCWAEFPVIDGIPVITVDPPATLRAAQNQVLARDDLPPLLSGVIGDALGQGTPFDTNRQHLNIYGMTHYADWVDGGAAQVPGIVARGLAAMGGAAEGPGLDLGCSVGRGTWELAARTGRPVLGADLNFAMLRMAQRLMAEGRVRIDRRRIGLVYDPVEAVVPSEMADVQVDFWAVDCMALPFRAGRFGVASALNLVDSITGPTNMLTEAARVLAPGAGAFFTTPHDWSANAAEPAAWMGGHSQRGPHGGAGEPVLRATLEHVGFEVVSEEDDVPWLLPLHSRSVMHYSMQLVGCRRAG